MTAFAPLLSEFPHIYPIATRWMDNDAYGHVNNVVYYSWFDTVVNQYLISHDVLDVMDGQVIGLVAETHCNYYRSVTFPETVRAGLRVGHLGRSSVRYEIGIFDSSPAAACAAGHFVHVYVERQSRKPCALPEPLRHALKLLMPHP